MQAIHTQIANHHVHAPVHTNESLPHPAPKEKAEELHLDFSHSVMLLQYTVSVNVVDISATVGCCHLLSEVGEMTQISF